MRLTKGRIFLLILIAIPVYYWLAYPSYTYRYRMTVEINTPEGVKSGSSVIEVHTTQWPEWLRHLAGGHVSNTKYKGEAPVVELGDGSYLFALLSKGDLLQDTGLAKYIAKVELLRNKNMNNIIATKKLQNMVGKVTEVSKTNIPTFVMFNEIDNPETAKIVSIFRQEYNLRRVLIEITTDPIEPKIKEVLPWLTQYKYRKFGNIGSYENVPDHLKKVSLSYGLFIKDN